MYRCNFVFPHTPQHVPQASSLNSVVWCSAWLRRHEIFACCSRKPSSSHRQRMRAHHAFLSPDPKRRFPTQACCLRADCQLSPWGLWLPHCSAQHCVPGEHQNSCSNTESASAARVEMKGQVLRMVSLESYFCLHLPVSLLLFPGVNMEVGKNPLSFLQYSSVDTKTSLQRCLNKKCFILWKCMSRVPPLSSHVNSDCIHITCENLQDWDHSIAKHQPWSLVLIIWGCDHHHNATMSPPCVERKKQVSKICLSSPASSAYT